MAITTATGYLDTALNAVVPFSTPATWADYEGTEWTNWRDWSPDRLTTFTYVGNLIDAGRIDYWNLKVIADAQGTVSYTVHASETGDFDSDITSTAISTTATDIAAFYGRYFIVEMTIDGGTQTPQLNSVTFQPSNQKLFEYLDDVNTTDLEGDVSGRTLALSRSYSRISNLQITPRAGGSYFVADYIQEGYVGSESVIANIITKDRTGPIVAFETRSGGGTDVLFDATVVGLPEQYYANNNLLIR